jgi:hypothetical protein
METMSLTNFSDSLTGALPTYSSTAMEDEGRGTKRARQ